MARHGEFGPSGHVRFDGVRSQWCTPTEWYDRFGDPASSQSPAILLASGSQFEFLAPAEGTFSVDDIAQGLAMLCRFAGQCRRFYSVAQHSVLVSRIVPPEDAYAGLMHDAAEAFLGDVSKPLKRLLPDYQRLEKSVEAAIFPILGAPVEIPASVKRADLIALATEQHRLMPDRSGRSYAGGHQPLDIDLPEMAWREAKAAFLARYEEVCP